DRAAGADRVDPQFVAPFRRAQHGSRVADTAQRAEREQALVFQPNASSLFQFVDVLATDRAGDAACARPRVCRADGFRRNATRAFESAALKVARRQGAETIERQQVGCSAKLAILGGRGTERPLRQVLAVLE